MDRDKTVEVTIISANDLKYVRTFGNQTCYAVAYIHPSQKKSTRLDKDGGVNPTWNSKLNLTCNDSLLKRAGANITVEIYSRGSFSNKLVGTASIGLQNVLNETSDEPKFLTIQVKRPSGEAHGYLNVSVKLGQNRILGLFPGKPTSKVSSHGYTSSPQDHLEQPWKQRSGLGSSDCSEACSENSYGSSYSASRTSCAHSCAETVYPPTHGVTSTCPDPSSTLYPPPQGYVRNGSRTEVPISSHTPQDFSSNRFHNSYTAEESVMAYPPPNWFNNSSSAEVARMSYPPLNGLNNNSNTDEVVQAYPPNGFCKFSNEAAMSYPPRDLINNSSVRQEPVMAYPSPAYADSYPQQYGQEYPYENGAQNTQQYFPTPQASAPYDYQQAYYSKPARKHGGGRGGLGMGLLHGRAPGGLSLGTFNGDRGF